MNRWWLVFVSILGFILVVSSCSPASVSPSPAPTPSPSPSQPPPSPQTPVEIKYISMSMTPIVAEPGQPVTVEVKVANPGGTAGSTKLGLTVNGSEAETKDVTIPPRAEQTVTFTVTENASGMYEIKVSGLTETLRVKQAGTYPRLGNYYGGPTNFFAHPRQIEQTQLKLLAGWDIIVVHYLTYRMAPEYIRQIKKLNPQIKILAWLEFGASDLWDLKTVLSSNESWYLHYADTPGNPKPPEQRRVKLFTLDNGDPWPAMNPASEWSTYVPNYVHDTLMSTGLFDGIFYDTIFDEISWLKNIDINNDGVADSPDFVNREYQNGMTQLLKLTRELLGPEAIIFGNPGAECKPNSPFWEYANGHMQENALGTATYSSHDFSKIWNIYQRNMQKPTPPSRIHWIAADTNNIEYDDLKPDLPPSELQKMRYGLAITLLDDGYFGFDRGDAWHCQLWWFPEYDTNLGFAMGDAQKRSDGTWMREFENGVVVVNPTSKESTIEFTTIHQDVTTDNKGTHFVVSPQDGRIFVVTD
jgi:hypothetical protein